MADEIHGNSPLLRRAAGRGQPAVPLVVFRRFPSDNGGCIMNGRSAIAGLWHDKPGGETPALYGRQDARRYSSVGFGRLSPVSVG